MRRSPNDPPHFGAQPAFRRPGGLLGARDELVESHQGLVRSIAWKIHQKVGKRVPLEDLISEGAVGLIEAANSFDRTRGNQFSTFAYYRIRGAILDGLNKLSWFDRAAYHGSRYERLAADSLATDAEDAPPQEHTTQWFDRACGSLAVSYMITQEGERQLASTLASDDAGPAESAVGHEMCDRLRQAIDRLPADAATLIRATYFEGLSLKAAGERIGISKSWASRLHHQTLQQLATILDPEAAGEHKRGEERAAPS